MSSSADRAKSISLPTFDQMMQVRKALEEERLAKTEVTGMSEEELAAERERIAEIARRTEENCANMRKEVLVERDRIINEAHERADVIRQKARVEGFDAAYDATEDDLIFARDNMRKVAEELEKTGKEMFAAIESQLLELSMQVVKKILYAELDKNNEAYLSIIEHALMPLRDEQHITLRMSPDGFDRIFGGFEPEINIDEMKARGIKVVRDPQVARGDCVVDSERGSFGMGVETQTSRMREAIAVKKGERAT